MEGVPRLFCSSGADTEEERVPDRASRLTRAQLGIMSEKISIERFESVCRAAVHMCTSEEDAWNRLCVAVVSHFRGEDYHGQPTLPLADNCQKTLWSLADLGVFDNFQPVEVARKIVQHELARN